MARNRFEESRSVLRRLIIKGTLILDSPTHLGGDDPSFVTDMAIARDAVDGKPILYGSTLAGLLRHWLQNRLEGGGRTHAWEAERCTTKFFGGPEENEAQSQLIVDDSRCEGTPSTDLRDGVSINPLTGIAEDKKKFDYELLRIGTEFPITMELLLLGDGEEDHYAIDYLLTCMDALEKGEVFLGARTRKGFGRCTIKEKRSSDGGVTWRWEFLDFDLKTSEGYRSWMAYGAGDLILPPGWPQCSSETYASAQDVLERKFASSIFQNRIHDNMTAEFRATLELEIDGTMIIRAEGDTAADSVHLSRVIRGDTPAQPIVSGTSLGGVIRARALRIAKTMERNGKAADLINGMFGASDASPKRSAGRVLVDEVPINGGRTLRHTRTMIDRWTGGSLEHHLFTEDVQVEGDVRCLIRVVRPKDEEVGLLLLVIKDLMTGDLAVGGESSVGRGRLLGRQGTMRYANGSDDPKEWGLSVDRTRRTLSVSGGVPISGYIAAFHRKLGYTVQEVSHGAE